VSGRLCFEHRGRLLGRTLRRSRCMFGRSNLLLVLFVVLFELGLFNR
jgi:hypothetical protein